MGHDDHNLNGGKLLPDQINYMATKQKERSWWNNNGSCHDEITWGHDDRDLNSGKASKRWNKLDDHLIKDHKNEGLRVAKLDVKMCGNDDGLVEKKQKKKWEKSMFIHKKIWK